MKSIKFSLNLPTNTHKKAEFFVGYSDCFITVNNYEVVEFFLVPSA